MAVHFIGFRDDRYWNAVRVFGMPDYIHRGWDRRALREIAEGDTVVFADGTADQEPRRYSFNDVDEGTCRIAMTAEGSSVLSIRGR